MIALVGLCAPAPRPTGLVLLTAYHQAVRPRAPEARDQYDNGYQRGYHDGRRLGTKDAERQRPYDPRRHGCFRDGGPGHRPGLRIPAAYASGYRRGFERAYHTSYVRSAGFHPDHDGYCDRHERRR